MVTRATNARLYSLTHLPVDRDLRVERAHDGREAVERAQPLLDALEVRLRDEVGLVEQHAVGERHLLDRIYTFRYRCRYRYRYRCTVPREANPSRWPVLAYTRRAVRHLLDGLVLGALGLLLVEVLLDVLGVDLVRM